MFSANENIALRQHKRRIIEYVEECIPDAVLDAGTTCMVMQVSCKAPGCVPLETVVMIVFPKSETELIPGIPESKGGGTYKTKVLLPMAQVKKQDVVKALPPPMGTRSYEKLCLQARDVMLAQITQLMGDEDQEGRDLMAQYLQTCLEEYRKRDCVAPEYGEPFRELDKSVEEKNSHTETTKVTRKHAPPAGNFVFRRDPEDNGGLKIIATTNGSKDTNKTTSSSTNGSANNTSAELHFTTSSTRLNTHPSTMDWRRQQDVERTMTPQSIISRLAEREHAPGVRMPGCPCCDPDNVSNYVDSMMML